MKMQRMVFILLISMIFTGCSSKTDQELLYDCQRKIHKMESYACEVEITVIGNRRPETYRMRQWFKKPNMYRLELLEPENLKGKTTIFDGKRAYIIHPQIGQVWRMEDFQNSEEQKMFLGYFIQNYLSSQNVEIHRRKEKNEEYLVIDIDIPGNHVYFSKERLWVHTKTLAPYLLQVFDAKDQMRIIVKYLDFQYNPSLEDDFFTAKNLANP